MTRKKVKLTLIANDSARKATFKKRKKGLMKKVNELTTLCGIQACAIIFSPYDSQPEIWPPSPYEVQQVLSQFKKMPEMEQSKKMVNQESFLRQRIGKANEQLKKQRKENREKEITQVMFESLTGMVNLNILDLNDLGWLIDQNLKEVNKKIETLNKVNSNSKTGAVAASSVAESSSGEAVVVVVEPPETAGSEVINADSMHRQQWFMDLINPPDQLGFGCGDEMFMPFSDQNQNQNQNGLWSSAFFR